MEAIEQILGAVPQVAVLDIAFHAHMPEMAAVYLDLESAKKSGVRRLQLGTADTIGRNVSSSSLLRTYSAVGIQNSGRNHKRRSQSTKRLDPRLFGALGDHAAGPLTSKSCFSGFEVSRA
jgi:hypothetical protein